MNGISALLRRDVREMERWVLSLVSAVSGYNGNAVVGKPGRGLSPRS